MAVATPTEVDLSVDLGRGLLRNPLLVASGTFGYGDRVRRRRRRPAARRHLLQGDHAPAAHRQPAAARDRDAGRDAQLDRAAEPGRRRGARQVRRDVGRLEGAGDRQRRRRVGRGLRRGRAAARRRPGVAGIELNISCPNVGAGGLQFAIDAGAAGEVTAAVRRATDLPLMVKLSPAATDVRGIAKAIANAGADAISAVNTLPGMAIDRASPAAAGQHLRRPVRPGAQARRAARRVRGRAGGEDPHRGDRRRRLARRRARLPDVRRLGGAGGHGGLRRSGAAAAAGRRARRVVPRTGSGRIGS